MSGNQQLVWYEAYSNAITSVSVAPPVNNVLIPPAADGNQRFMVPFKNPTKFIQYTLERAEGDYNTLFNTVDFFKKWSAGIDLWGPTFNPDTLVREINGQVIPDTNRVMDRDAPPPGVHSYVPMDIISPDLLDPTNVYIYHLYLYDIVIDNNDNIFLYLEQSTSPIELIPSRTCHPRMRELPHTHTLPINYFNESGSLSRITAQKELTVGTMLNNACFKFYALGILTAIVVGDALDATLEYCGSADEGGPRDGGSSGASCWSSGSGGRKCTAGTCPATSNISYISDLNGMIFQTLANSNLLRIFQVGSVAYGNGSTESLCCDQDRTALAACDSNIVTDAAHLLGDRNAGTVDCNIPATTGVGWQMYGELKINFDPDQLGGWGAGCVVCDNTIVNGLNLDRLKQQNPYDTRPVVRIVELPGVRDRHQRGQQCCNPSGGGTECSRR